MTAASPQPQLDYDATLVDAEVRDMLIGLVVDDRYRVERLLGEGGMGRVYEVTDVTFRRRLVLKTLLPLLSEDGALFDRFLREARAAAKLGSPHIVGVSDFGMLGDGRCYYVMQHADGVTLESTLDGLRSPMDPTRALEITRGITRAVADAHAGGVIHRDLKPDNIVLCARDGRSDFVKLLDFGLAYVASDEARLTLRGELVGTPHYMAPEQCSDRPVDERADLYAIGVMLYEMLTLELPIDGETFPQLIQRKLSERPLLPSTLDGCGHLSVDVETLVMRLIAREPSARLQSTQDLLRALDGILGPESSGLYPLEISGEEPTLFAVPTPAPEPPSPELGAPLPSSVPPATASARFRVAEMAPASKSASNSASNSESRSPLVPILLFIIAVLVVALGSAGIGWALAHPHDSPPVTETPPAHH